LLFREQGKERMLFRFNRYAIVGLLFLGASLSGATLLVTSILFGLPAAVTTCLVVAVGVTSLWLVRPLRSRVSAHADDA
jgi:uncharacterized membrane protein